MADHIITTKHISGMAFTALINGHPVKMDDGDSAPSPKRLMLAAFAGCTGIDVVSILNKMKVPFKALEINVEASLTDTHPKIYKDVRVIYYIQVEETDRPKMEKAVKLSQEKYCGVSAMFKAFSKITSEIVYK